MDKICTSLVQSYKLLELKFDASTADMCWATGLLGESFPDWKVLCMSPEEYKNIESKWTAVPAWSLPALTELVMNKIKSSWYTDTKLEFYRAKPINKSKYDHYVCYSFRRVSYETTRVYQDGLCTGMHGELLDAMFELVCLMRKESLL